MEVKNGSIRRKYRIEVRKKEEKKKSTKEGGRGRTLDSDGSRHGKQ